MIRNLLHSLTNAGVATLVILVLSRAANLVTPVRHQKWITVVRMILLLLIWTQLVLSVIHQIINMILF